ncbi:MAG: hypothetical protein AMXMBFR33_47200 [Candidatus Xenobia bacterium]
MRSLEMKSKRLSASLPDAIRLAGTAGPASEGSEATGAEGLKTSTASGPGPDAARGPGFQASCQPEPIEVITL